MIALEKPLVLAIALPLTIAIVLYTHLYGYSYLYRKLYTFRHSLVGVARKFLRYRMRWRLSTLALKIAIAILLAIALAEPYIVVKEVVPLGIHGVSEIEIRVRPPLVLVVDTSGSMGGYKIMTAKQALLRFVENLSNIDIGFIEFADTIKRGVPPTNNRAKILRYIESMEASGGTMYSYALETALTWLKPYRELNITCFVVMVTDGLPADKVEYRELLKEFKKLKIPIYTVFIGTETEGIKETKFIARETGGKQYTARDVSKLAEKLSSIARDIKKKLERIEVEMKVTKEVEKRYPVSMYLLIAAIALYLYLRYRIFKISGISF